MDSVQMVMTIPMATTFLADPVESKKNDLPECAGIPGDFFVHLCRKDSSTKSRKIEFLKKILEFLTKIWPDDVIVTIKILPPP